MISGQPSTIVDYARLRPFLENFASRSHGRWTADGLEASIRERDKQVWTAGDWQAVVLTEVGPTWVKIIAGGGRDRGDWQVAMDATITAWAREMGKTHLFAHARPGWLKFGKQQGYRQIHVEAVKVL